MATIRSDIIIPAVFSPYVEEQTTLRSAFMQSGVLRPMPQLNMSDGGDYVEVPSFDADLSGDAEVLADNTSLTPGKIGADKQIAAVLHRGRAWEVRDLARLAAGADPMGAIANKVAAYIANQQQKDLISTMRGVFGPLTSNTTGVLKALAIDSNATATTLGPRQIAECRAALGDQGEKLSTIVVHSKVFYDLVERRAIDYVTNAEARQTVSTVAAGSLDIPNAFAGSLQGAYVSDINVPFYMGMRVIVSDDVANDGTNYACYVFAPGSVGTGEQMGLVTETDRDILALSDAMSVHWHNVLHPIGMRYKSSTGGANPSRATLETVTNWEQVFETKNLGFASIVVNPNF